MGGDPNLNHPECDHELLDDPFRLRAMRIGGAGAAELGATMYEIE